MTSPISSCFRAGAEIELCPFGRDLARAVPSGRIGRYRGVQMAPRITYAQVSASYRDIAEAVGIDASTLPRTRMRDPQKAASLRRAGIPADQIGPIGTRRYFSRSLTETN